MPGGHNENTRLLGFYANRELAHLVDRLRKSKSRSQFMREATIEYLERHQVVVPRELKDPPDRAGKGGPSRPKISSTAKDQPRETAQQAARTAALRIRKKPEC
jgi:hypothetical protein